MSRGVTHTALAFQRVWRHVDAKDQTLGRLATVIATSLIGKYKPIFDPSVDSGDYVVVTNASQIVVTGKKAEQKNYYSHSQYPGALKIVPYAHMMQYNPTRIIQKAVSGMLPKNKLRKRRLARLLIYAEPTHPYDRNIIKNFETNPYHVTPPPSSSSPSTITTDLTLTSFESFKSSDENVALVMRAIQDIENTSPSTCP